LLFRVDNQPAHRRHKLSGLAGGDEESFDLIRDHFRNRPNPRGHDGQTVGEGFK
jgi:hypothetical protein